MCVSILRFHALHFACSFFLHFVFISLSMFSSFLFIISFYILILFLIFRFLLNIFFFSISFIHFVFHPLFVKFKRFSCIATIQEISVWVVSSFQVLFTCVSGGLCTVHFEKFLFTNFSKQFTTLPLLYTRDIPCIFHENLFLLPSCKRKFCIFFSSLFAFAFSFQFIVNGKKKVIYK